MIGDNLAVARCVARRLINGLIERLKDAVELSRLELIWHQRSKIRVLRLNDRLSVGSGSCS